MCDLMKNSFKYQTAIDPKGLAVYLKTLAEGVESGAVPLVENDKTVIVFPQGLMDFEIKVRRKNGRAKISLNMAWAEKPDDCEEG